ncbi:MAG: hypothetical protein B6244_01895 [Candidatus Cloacimonetes bacterium 4572_55]|nr:MAG: hypothetical protein B6244_01895 [Candidatus Cloacimonetes bacterium 4572_55]
MKPIIFALATSLAWGVGSYFEKKGLQMGRLSPQMGITLRTVVALFVLSTISFNQWKSVLQADPKALMWIIVGGGVIAGSIGMLCFYAAIRSAPLSLVLPIAFTSPLFGALMGIWFGGEPLTWKVAVGILLTIGGVTLITMK